MKSKITKEDLEQLYVREGKRIKDIAIELECSRATVTNALQRFGFKTGIANKEKAPSDKKLMMMKKKEQIKELYLSGLSSSKVGEIVGLSEKTVGWHLKQMGVAIRPLRKINQQEFEELWALEKSDEEIAEYFGVSVLTVKTFRTRGDNAGKFNRKQWFSQEEHTLNHIQLQFLLGTLLGDSALTKPNCNSRVNIIHCDAQRDLFMEKVKILGDFMGAYKLYNSLVDPRTNKIYPSWKGSSKHHPEFTKLYEMIYVNGVKTVTEKWLSKIDDPIALAFWWMDDGTHCGTIATNSFSLEECTLLKNWLWDKWSILATIQSNLSNYVIRISEKSRYQFEKLIFPYIIPSMYYKLKYVSDLIAESTNSVNSGKVLKS